MSSRLLILYSYKVDSWLLSAECINSDQTSLDRVLIAAKVSKGVLIEHFWVKVLGQIFISTLLWFIALLPRVIKFDRDQN